MKINFNLLSCVFFRVSNFESSAIQDLREKILASRTQLVQEFEKYDKSVTGLITDFISKILLKHFKEILKV